MVHTKKSVEGVSVDSFEVWKHVCACVCVCVRALFWKIHSARAIVQLANGVKEEAVQLGCLDCAGCAAERSLKGRENMTRF